MVYYARCQYHGTLVWWAMGYHGSRWISEIQSRCWFYVNVNVGFFKIQRQHPNKKKTRGSVMKKFYASARVLRRTFFLFLFTYLGSTFSGSLGIIMLLLPTSSPLQKIGLTFTFNFQPKSFKAGYALVWFETYDNIQPVSNSDLWVDLELFKSWHFWGIYGQMACKNTTAFGDLQKSTNDVWLKSVCLHKYTYALVCTTYSAYKIGCVVLIGTYIHIHIYIYIYIHNCI